MQRIKIKLRFIIWFSFVVAFSLTDTFGQSRISLSFQETHPENNIDSLENWLSTNRISSRERLSNLIKLIRTYEHNGIAQSHTQLNEIVSLSNKLNVKWGIFYAEYMRTPTKAYFNLLELKKEFELAKDTDGIIFSLSRLIVAHYDETGLEVGNKNLTGIYLSTMEKLLDEKKLTHSHIEYFWAKYISIYGKKDFDYEEVKDFMEKTVREIASNQEFHYSLLRFKSGLAISNYYLQNYQKSYELNKWVLKRLHPKALYRKILYTQNLANDCEFLGRYEERIKLNQEVIYLIKTNALSYKQTLSNAYLSLKEEMFRKGLYKEAALYADSVIMLQDSLYEMNHRKDLLELQTKLEVSAKENRIKELNAQRKAVEEKNNIYLLLALLLSIGFFTISALSYKVYTTNEKYKNLYESREQFIKILAHDLRRPLNTFTGMAGVMAKLLKRGDTENIVKIAHSIDESAIQTIQLLDNTLYWSISNDTKVFNERKVFELQPHIEAVIDLFKFVILNQNITLKIEINPQIRVITDPNAFDLIFRNLLDNAIKNSPTNGGILIKVAESDKKCALEITNKGFIEEKTMSAIKSTINFPEKSSPKQGGLGLGLIIVSKFVKQNYLALDVISTVENGTTFTLNLPLA